jgi:hypothetical protein
MRRAGQGGVKEAPDTGLSSRLEQPAGFMPRPRPLEQELLAGECAAPSNGQVAS